MSRRVSLIALSLWLVVLSGCSSLFHPRAEEFFNQAKGETGVDTALALTDMMNASLEQAKSEIGESTGLADLHDQFHALHHSFCDVTESQAATPAYTKAVTLSKEMREVFHRLWKYKDNQTLRTLHLDLFATRLQELRQTLQAIQA